MTKKNQKVTSDEFRAGFDKGYALGLREGFSEGRYAATMRIVELNISGK